MEKRLPMHPFESLDVPNGAVGIHWFGQSSYGLKDTAGTVVLADPYFPHDRPADTFIHPEPPLDEASLPTDFVLLTHDHGDHTHPETLRRIAAAHPQARYVGPPNSIAHMKACGMDEQRMCPVEAGSAAVMGTMTAHAVWAKPPKGNPENGIGPPDTPHLGYVIEAGDVRVYLSGDPINTFDSHGDLIRPIRNLHPDVGLLTNHPREGEFPFFDGCARMAAHIGLKDAVPAHYDCFVERTYDPRDWARAVAGTGVTPIILPYDSSIVYPTAN